MTPSKLERFISTLTNVVMVMFALIIASGYYYLVMTSPPTIEESYTHPWPLSKVASNAIEAKTFETTTVIAGEPMYAYREFCELGSHRNSYVIDYIINMDTNYIVKLAVKPVIGDLGCLNLSTKFVVPKGTPPGNYIFYQKIFTNVNVFRSYTQVANPVRFVLNKS